MDASVPYDNPTVWALWVLITRVLVTETAVTNWGKVFHTGLTKQADATAELIVVTTGAFSSVRVTGTVTGHHIDTVLGVMANSPEVVTIPLQYLDTETTSKYWKKESKGLKIESQTAGDIGVRLVTRSSVGKGSGAITVLPDAALGTEYRLASGNTADSSGPDEILIVASAASTTVTLTWGEYDITGLTVNGKTAQGATHTVVLEENETLHMNCGSECFKISVTSDKNLAVIGGKEDNQFVDQFPTKGRTLTQNVPSKYAGTQFVAFGPSTSQRVGLLSVVSVRTPVVGDTSIMCAIATPEAAEIICSDSRMIPMSEPLDLLVKSTKPLLMYSAFSGHETANPSNFYLPNINQYSTSQSIYLEEGYQYHVIVTGASIGGISVHVQDNISIKFSGLTLCRDPQYGSRSRQVSNPAGVSIQYEIYTNSEDFVVEDKNAAKKEGGLVEFRAAELNKPFLVIVSEIDAMSKAASTTTAFGIKYVLAYDAATCVKTTTEPNDGIDNDCDGRVDEEIKNLLDEDGDGEADEDLGSIIDFRVACLFDDVEHATRTPTYCSLGIDEGVTYSCKPGYKHTGGTLQRTCESSVTLSGTKPSCTKTSQNAEYHNGGVGQVGDRYQGDNDQGH